MWWDSENREKDTSKYPQNKPKGGNDERPEGIEGAKKVRGGSALDKRMCEAGFKKHCK